jgi:hypothetical protein
MLSLARKQKVRCDKSHNVNIAGFRVRRVSILCHRGHGGHRGDRETGRQGDRETGRQGDRETERQGDRETERIKLSSL